MKSILMIICACATLSIGHQAFANDLEDQAYDEGWDAARDFCEDVQEDTYRTYSSRSITRTFIRNCKQGFDAYIDNNRTCKRKLEGLEDGYRLMWKARGDSCS